METETPNKQYFLSLQLIAIALIVGQLLFLFVTLMIHKQDIVFDLGEANSPYGYTILFLSIAISLIFVFYSRTQFSKITMEVNKEKKKTVLQSTILMRYAFLEGISLIAIVFFLVSSNLYFLVFSLLSIIVQINVFPKKAKILERLQ